MQIHGLPIEKMTRTNAESIGKRFGRLLAVETAPHDILLGRSFSRIKAEIKITEPLPKGFWLRRRPKANGDLWISYKYENLSDFCYACGRIGHDSKSCKLMSREEGLGSGYGLELHTGRVRAFMIPIEEIRSMVVEVEILGG